MIESINSLDWKIILWVQNNLRCPFLNAVFVPLTRLGNAGAVFLAACILLMLWKKTRRAGIIMLIALFVNFVVNNLIIKNIVARARPFNSIEDFLILINPPGGYSFPSGHTSSAFAASVTLFFTGRKYVPWALIFAFLMGFSRIYVGVHYPSDVLTGAILGSLIAVISAISYRLLIDEKRIMIKKNKN